MISLISAMSKNRVIGNNGKVPWHITEDYIYFNKKTSGHPIIEGRKTYESTTQFENHKGWSETKSEILKHKLLPNRTNIIVTRQENYKVPGAIVVKSLDDAIAKAKQSPGSEEIFIIGGGEIYRESMNIADRIYLTVIEAEVEGDTFFPLIDEKLWELTSSKKRTVQVLDSKIIYYFNVYNRINECS